MTFLIELFTSKEKWLALEDFLQAKFDIAIVGRWNAFAFVLVPIGTISFWVSQSDLLSPEANSEGAVMRLDFHEAVGLASEARTKTSVLLFDGLSSGEYRVEYNAPSNGYHTTLAPKQRHENEGKLRFGASSVSIALPMFGSSESLGILAAGAVPKSISITGGELPLDAVPTIGFPNRSGIVIWAFALAAFSIGISLSGAFVSKAESGENATGQHTG